MADLYAHWADHPPVQWMVQAYLGIKPRTPERVPTEAECSAFLTTMGVKADPKPSG